MEKELQESFKSDLYRTITYFGNDNIQFGKKVATSIAEKVEEICKCIDTIRKKPDFTALLTKKYSSTRIFPKKYKDNGCASCDNLFFEYRFEPHGVYVGIGFYMPSLFSNEKQKKELAFFTTKYEEKVKNPRSIEFYFVVAESPEII